MDVLASPADPLKTGLQNGHTSATEPIDQHAAPQQDLWSSILNSVKSSKAISTKNVVLLGEPASGKSSLLTALASTSPSGLVSGRSSYAQDAPTTTAVDDKTPATAASRSSSRSVDLGLAYAYFDVPDEKDRDETVARVGAYTIHSSHAAYTSLLPYAFPESNLSSTEQDAAAAMATLASAAISSSAAGPASSPDPNRVSSGKASIDSLRDSLVVIVLDWEQPWTFLEQLRNWISILRELIDRASDGALSSQQQRDAKWSKTRVALDEMRERLEAYIRAYVEPAPKPVDAGSGADANALASATEQDASTDASALAAPITTVNVQLEGGDDNPLTDGMLTDNLGIPIVVVCTKADAISRLERDSEFKDEQFDYIQQVLRTVCMKYGAALFYTSSMRAQSIDILRSYLLHRLFTPSHQQHQQQTGTGASASAGGVVNGAAAGGAAVFGFAYRASTTDRDTLLVPAGWDSWGKIRALREPFDCQGLGKGWESDCEIERQRRARGLARTKEVEDQLEKELQLERRDGEEVQSAMKLYEDIVSDWQAGPAGKDTVNKVRIPDEQAFLGGHHATLQKDPDPRAKLSKRGVVGPMTGASAALPSVEKYMARESKEPTEAKPRIEPVRRESTSAAAAAAVAAMTGERSRPASPAMSPGAASPGAPKQSEVLHSFFQSLLKDKGSGVGSPKPDRLNRASSRRDPPPQK
ncbi:DLIC-domain-containing protein [Moesziomyces antarcticus]|uniref:Related to dynein light-intermediate chain n=2 Tax=Pseudozyma antarctica TaxID=84753 RepID=A0A5C3FTF1_PSEA2|nr:DLIC-domain-containing protein [Moesziomyces antarcticus]GAK65623.1 DLIC-domain-containing protein [Moesziomyces antarcticus]SPO46639.1 related to dynein light-intermediate chain [Moesziomyces antarcticus]